MPDTPPLRKFMFERSFDNGAGHHVVPERKPVLLKADQIDALKKEAFDAGLAAGQKALGDRQNEALAATLLQLDQQLCKMIGNFEELRSQQEALTRTLVLSVAKKILPEFAERHGLQEIEAILGTVLAEMTHEPRFVVRVHETLCDSVMERVQEISTQKAYAGKVVVLADPGLALGDCRIEWADGGIERNTAATLQSVEETLDIPAPASGTLPSDNSDKINQETDHG